MRADILLKIRSNPNLNNYIRYHSYWYKELMRYPDKIKQMEMEMKKEYKLTTEDKISKAGEKIELIRTFLEVLK
ncbi:MAG: YlbE-like family protein [bacterium]|nr:YlbE-like family protein [bacterium]